MINYINKEFVSDTGVLVRTHYINCIRALRNTQGIDVVIASVKSFGSVQSLVEGDAPRLTQSFEVGPLSAPLDSAVYGAVYEIFIADESSVFYGGVLEEV